LIQLNTTRKAATITTFAVKQTVQSMIVPVFSCPKGKWKR